MFSESDEEEPYTVHEVQGPRAPLATTSEASHRIQEDQEVRVSNSAKEESSASSPLARYYRLGTQQRHAFDEHMRRLREEAQRAEQERHFREQHPFHPARETLKGVLEGVASPSAAAAPTLGSSSLSHDTTKHSSPDCALGADALRDDSNERHSAVRPVFDRLATQAAQLELRRRHREEQKRRAEAAALRDAFQPRINRSHPEDAEPLRHVDDIPVEERLLHYGETVAREHQRRRERKALEEKMALQSAQASVIGAAAQSQDPQERRRQQREFQDRTERFLAERAKHRTQAEEAAAGAYSFQPHISATSAALDEARQLEVLEAREAELRELISRSADGASLSTTRQSHPTSSLREASRRSDALYAQAVAKQQQEQQRCSSAGGSSFARAGATGEPADSSHQPRTNPTSEKWIAGGAHRAFFQQDFVRRQALYEQVRQEEATLGAATAQPSTSLHASEPRSGSGGGSPRKVKARELNERLYYNAKKASEAAERRREAALNARECPFRPSLSPGTEYALRCMKHSRDADVVRRLTSTRQKVVQERDDREVKESLYAPASSARRSRRGPNAADSSAQSSSSRAASAPPKASASSSPLPAPTSGQSPENAVNTPSPPTDSTETPRQHASRPVVTRDQIETFYQRQMDALQQRQDLIQERKEGRAVQELVECTFRPRTNADRRGGSASTASPTKHHESAAPLNRVTGVSGFLERQAVARRRKAEHEEAMRTLGLPRASASSAAATTTSTGATILSPFAFETEQRRQRASRSPAQQQRTRSPVVAGFPNGTATSSLPGQPSRSSPPVWVHALTASERAMYDALAESQLCPASARAPLLPLPGYRGPDDAFEREEEEREEDAVYFDEVDEHAGLGGGAYDLPRDAMSSMSPFHEQNSCFNAVEADDGSAAHREKASLFSSLSPNTFSGRTLHGNTYGNSHTAKNNGQGLGYSRAAVPARPSPSSALKGAAATELTSSASRRKQRRKVSFLEDDVPASARSSSRSARLGQHIDPNRRLAH